MFNICIYANLLFQLEFYKRNREKIIKYFYLPTKAEFLNITEEYLSEEHPRYFESFSQKQWDIFYSENIYKDVSINDLHSF